MSWNDTILFPYLYQMPWATTKYYNRDLHQKPQILNITKAHIVSGILGLSFLASTSPSLNLLPLWTYMTHGETKCSDVWPYLWAVWWHPDAPSHLPCLLSTSLCSFNCDMLFLILDYFALDKDFLKDLQCFWTNNSLFSFISIKLAGSLCYHQPKWKLQPCIFDRKELRLFLQHSSKKDSLSFLW